MLMSAVEKGFLYKCSAKYPKTKYTFKRDFGSGRQVRVLRSRVWCCTAVGHSGFCKNNKINYAAVSLPKNKSYFLETFYSEVTCSV